MSEAKGGKVQGEGQPQGKQRRRKSKKKAEPVPPPPPQQSLTGRDAWKHEASPIRKPPPPPTSKHGEPVQHMTCKSQAGITFLLGFTMGSLTAMTFVSRKLTKRWGPPGKKKPKKMVLFAGLFFGILFGAGSLMHCDDESMPSMEEQKRMDNIMNQKGIAVTLPHGLGINKYWNKENQ